jgi:subtilisin family serine protease
MFIRFFSVLFIVFVLVLLGCQEQAPVEMNSDTINSGASLSKKPQGDLELDGHYIIIAEEEAALPAGLDAAVAAANGSVTGKIEQLGLAAAFSEDPDFMNKAGKIDGIMAVIPDIKIDRIKPFEQPEAVTVDAASPPFTGDDDFFFDLQWGHDAVDAPEAWEAGYRGAGVRVFVLDEGFDMDHPDLAPNINYSLATSFVDGEPTPEYLLNDSFSHGSHTSGTIAAADNGYGTIGVAPEVELVPVKVLSEILGFGYSSWIINGVYYAALNGADVINMSLGGGGFKSLNAPGIQLYYMVPYKRALNYAYQMGATVVVSAGNDALDRNKTMDLLIMPADAPNVLTISATAPLGWAADFSTNLDEFAFYSNYGTRSIDFAAPGGTWELYYYPGGTDLCTVGFVTRPCYVFDYVFSVGSNGAWYWGSGTSMAAPHAAGVAALIIGKNGGSMDPAEVKAIMKQTADDLGKPGRDAYYGFGRVNAYKAVM